MKHFLLVIVVLLMFVPAASADTLDVVSGDATWHGFQTPTTYGANVFWNNASYDGIDRDCNIGFWLSGLGGCSAKASRFYDGSPRATAEYLGDSSTRFGFTQDGTTESVTVTVAAHVTSWFPANEFGWYLLGEPSSRLPLFGRFSPQSGSATFIPSGDYGFYLTSRHDTYYSNASEGTTSHFVVFRMAGDGHYVIGAEDMWWGSDWDYNDMILNVQVNAIPEPASLLLVGTGLAGLFTAIRRKRRGR